MMSGQDGTNQTREIPACHPTGAEVAAAHRESYRLEIVTCQHCGDPIDDPHCWRDFSGKPLCEQCHEIAFHGEE
jgi:hypothetical protein